ncbi:MAG: Spy/CpxP family protein refolding chaperone [Deltaproteobacteria bacterium]|nr:Spy/CpxP family protein refolding chaperone [Deltaproteobacteria bacterium]
MKKVLTTLGILVLVGFLAAPVFAHRYGGGKNYGGPGSGPCWYEGGNLTDDQRAELEKLHQQYVDDTAKLREEIWNKSAELDTLLNSSNPDPKKAKGLQREISDLKTKMSDKRLDFELKARKIAPNARSGRGYGKGYGRGYGHGHGGGYHHGYHGGYGHRGQYGDSGSYGGYGRGGYGPCWN